MNYLLKHYRLTTMNEIANVTKLYFSFHFRDCNIKDYTTYHDGKRAFRHIHIGSTKIRVNYHGRIMTINYNDSSYFTWVELLEEANCYITIQELLSKLDYYRQVTSDIPF